jgi:hypothetical protein
MAAGKYTGRPGTGAKRQAFALSDRLNKTLKRLGLEMRSLSSEAKFRWDLTTFTIALFLTVCDILARLYSPPMWVSNWPHWTWKSPWAETSCSQPWPWSLLQGYLNIRERRTNFGGSRFLNLSRHGDLTIETELLAEAAPQASTRRKLRKASHSGKASQQREDCSARPSSG